MDVFPVLKDLVICVMCLLTYHARLGHLIKSEERLAVTATITALCIRTRRLLALNYGNLQFKDILKIFSKLIFLAVAPRGGKSFRKDKTHRLTDHEVSGTTERNVLQ